MKGGREGVMGSRDAVRGINGCDKTVTECCRRGKG